MEKLDQWTDKNVIDPIVSNENAQGIHDIETDNKTSEKAYAAVKKSIREKVLQSYRNGQKAGPRPEKKGSK